ncbi:hypothetical protein QZH41_015342, partial [Actinostola sp. cb2023]
MSFSAPSLPPVYKSHGRRRRDRKGTFHLPINIKTLYFAILYLFQLLRKDLVNGRLIGYRIKYTKQGGTTKTVDVGVVTTWTLTSLEKYTGYNVTVAVKNSRFVGLPSQPVTKRTLEDAPVCAPRLTSVQAVSSTSIRVTWAPPPNTKCRNGVLRGYKVAYKLNKVGSKTNYFDVKDGRATTIVVSGLVKYTEYSLQILVYTIKNGPLSRALVKRTNEDAPVCAPRLTSVQAVSSTSIRVTWAPPPNTKCRNGVLRGYKVAYKLNRRGSTINYLDVKNGRATTIVVSGLVKYTEYSLQVLAYTIKNGPLSRALVKRTKEDGPSCAPKLTSAQVLSSTSVRVTWTPPPNTKCRNGVLRGYKVAFKLNKVGSKTNYFDVKDGSATTTVVSGLDKNTWYSFHVLAYTVKDGLLSNVVVKRTNDY